MDTIRAWRCFVRAVELGSLSAVAREEGSTQPTVSKLMAALERELGVRLLERSTTSLRPTPQGRCSTSARWACWRSTTRPWPRRAARPTPRPG
ncbi:MAG: LysR family transcriptional regulator [Duganella sp.]